MTTKANSTKRPVQQQSLSRGRRALLRLGVGVIAFLALGGPSPGYVGGCSATAAAPPDAREYCINKSGLVCQRDFYADRIDMAGFNACVGAIVPMCDRSAWSSCVPNQAQTQACLAALSDSSRFLTPDAEIVECQITTWCPPGI